MLNGLMERVLGFFLVFYLFQGKEKRTESEPCKDVDGVDISEENGFEFQKRSNRQDSLPTTAKFAS